VGHSHAWSQAARRNRKRPLRDRADMQLRLGVGQLAALQQRELDRRSRGRDGPLRAREATLTQRGRSRHRARPAARSELGVEGEVWVVVAIDVVGHPVKLLQQGIATTVWRRRCIDERRGVPKPTVQ